MKVTILFAICVIVACNARPQQQDAPAAAGGANPNDATVVSSQFDNIGIDGYKFGLVDEWSKMNIIN